MPLSKLPKAIPPVLEMGCACCDGIRCDLWCENRDRSFEPSIGVRHVVVRVCHYFGCASGVIRYLALQTGAGQRFYQFTAIDEATRFRVLRIYDHDNTKTAIDFLREVQEHFPFAIQKIQTGNGSSFGPQFTWHLSDLRISHRHIPPGLP
jgi:integrase-like protein